MINQPVPIISLAELGDKDVVCWGLCDLFMGVSASGKTVNVNGVIIFRLENKKIVEYWGNFEMLGLMKQIGAMS